VSAQPNANQIKQHLLLTFGVLGVLGCDAVLGRESEVRTAVLSDRLSVALDRRTTPLATATTTASPPPLLVAAGGCDSFPLPAVLVAGVATATAGIGAGAECNGLCSGRGADTENDGWEVGSVAVIVLCCSEP